MRSIEKVAAVGLIAATAFLTTPATAANKADLAAAMAQAAGISKAQAAKALDAFAAVTAKSLSKGERVSIAGFGSFSTSKRAARTGRNPQTGAMIRIPARTSVKFKPGKALDVQVNRTR